MTKRLALAAMALALCMGAGAAPAEPTLDEDFGLKVRAYLLAHPEIILEVFDLLEAQQAQAERAESGARIAQFSEQLFGRDELGPGDGYFGNPDGAVRVVQFFDYQCSYCKANVPELSSALSSRDDVVVFLKELPILGPESEKASRIALAVRLLYGNSAYLAFHDSLMVHRGPLSDAAISGIIEASGLDYAAVSAKATGAEIEAIIDANKALAADLSINGTPAFVFQDAVVAGLMGADQLTEAFDRNAQASGK